ADQIATELLKRLAAIVSREKEPPEAVKAEGELKYTGPRGKLMKVRQPAEAAKPASEQWHGGLWLADQRAAAEARGREKGRLEEAEWWASKWNSGIGPCPKES